MTPEQKAVIDKFPGNWQDSDGRCASLPSTYDAATYYIFFNDSDESHQLRKFMGPFIFLMHCGSVYYYEKGIIGAVSMNDPLSESEIALVIKMNKKKLQNFK